jgi:hypothetical protein
MLTPIEKVNSTQMPTSKKSAMMTASDWMSWTPTTTMRRSRTKTPMTTPMLRAMLNSTMTTAMTLKTTTKLTRTLKPMKTSKTN